MRFRTLLLATLAVSAIAACKKKEEAPAAAVTPPPPPPPPAPTVSSIELGKHIGPNKRVTDTTSTFGVRDTVYLAVLTENTTAGSNLVAKWTFQTGQTVDSTSQAIAAPDAANPVTVTEFHISKKTAWPAGKYKVEVMLDGASKGVRDFEIKK